MAIIELREIAKVLCTLRNVQLAASEVMIRNYVASLVSVLTDDELKRIIRKTCRFSPKLRIYKAAREELRRRKKARR